MVGHVFPGRTMIERHPQRNFREPGFVDLSSNFARMLKDHVLVGRIEQIQANFVKHRSYLQSAHEFLSEPAF